MNRTPGVATAYFGLATVGHFDWREKQHLYAQMKFLLSFCCLAMAFLGIAWSSYVAGGPALWPWESDLLQRRSDVPAVAISKPAAMKSFATQRHLGRLHLALRKHEPNASAVTRRQNPRIGPSASKFGGFDLGALPDDGAGYMWYAPHSGFSNQARELANALKIAFLLNRTLVIPPVLDHFELEQGPCLTPAHNPSNLRRHSWEAIVSRFDAKEPKLRPYVSIADVVDLNSIKSLVKTIDFRVFLMLLCGLNISAACSGPICREMIRDHEPSDSVVKNVKKCESILFPKGASVGSSSRFRRRGNDKRHKGLVYEVDEDCRSVVWTHKEPQDLASALQFILMDSLRSDKSILQSGSATHPDRAPLNIVRKDLMLTLGTPSRASRSPILSFGNMFSRPYRNKDLSFTWPYVKQMQLMVDIYPQRGDQQLEDSLQAIRRQPFSKHILDAATEFIKQNIKGPFFCAHLRLNDGAFVGEKNQEQRIFRPLQAKLNRVMSKISNRSESPSMSGKDRPPLNVFVMTDRARAEWNSSRPLLDLTVNPLYEIHSLDGMHSLLRTATRNMFTDERGLALGFLPNKSSSAESKSSPLLTSWAEKFNIRLFVEEVVCSCATLGFQGTAASSLSHNIKDLRKANTCPLRKSHFTLDSQI